MGRRDEALGSLSGRPAGSPRTRAASSYAYLDLLLQMGRPKDVLADIEERLRAAPTDPRLYELQAHAFEAVGKPVAQHRSLAEAQYRREPGRRGRAAFEIAVRSKGDFYESSSAEARLREMRALLENERAAEKKALKIS